MLPDFLVKQFVSELNPGVDVFSITRGSEKKLWWECEKGHQWLAAVYARIHGTGCPYCSGRVAIPGVNDVFTQFPLLKEELASGKNTNIVLDSLKSGSEKKLWWECKTCHGQWEAMVANRTAGKGCPVCAGRKVLVGFNDLASVHPVLAKQWHPTKNGILTPEGVTKSSGCVVWWKCEKGHDWKAPVDRRVYNKSTCPICSGHKVSPSVNSITVTHPEIASMWHSTKNSPLTADEVSFGHSSQRWWVGKGCGHDFQASVKQLVRGNGCSVCAGKQIIVGVNDFATLNPVLLQEWHPLKNIPLSPLDFTKGSSQKIWWKCVKGHEWITSISERTQGKGCAKCSNHVSKGEKSLGEFFKTLGVNFIGSDRKTLGNRQELDFFFPELNIAVEYNGLYWHSADRLHRNYHYDKWLTTGSKGIQLIQIWEDDWLTRPEVVKSMLAYKLGLNQGERVFARKTQVRLLSQQDVNLFLDENHIQGAVHGGVRLGLTVIDTLTGVENSSPVERLVAVMLLKAEPGSEGKTLNLLRFATSQCVVGGFTKLLKQAEQIEGAEKIITFSDNTISDGGLYESSGFIADKELKPDYMYVVGGERKHKFGFRLKKFRDDPGLEYVEGLTERELALLNNIPRIWDAGKTRWVKQVKS